MNIVKVEGRNIVGDDYLGGNYWSSPDGRDFSDACSDRDGDGIYDEPLVIDENNVDYLPLKPAQLLSPTPIPIPTPTPTPTPLHIPIIVLE